LYGGIVILYTTFGGLRGTAIAIMIQGIIMTVATFLLVFGSIRYIGGVEIAFRTITSRTPDFVTPAGTLYVTIAYIFSLWVTFGFAISALPHGIMGALVYKNTKAMHKANIIGGILVVIWTVLLNSLGGIIGRAANPELQVPDHNLPFLAFKSLSPAFGGIILAGIAGAIQSTVGIMLIVISSTIVRNLYSTYINPMAQPARLKKVTMGVTVTIGIVVFLLAFAQPPALEWIIVFAIGGLASAFLVPILGLYWPRATQWGAAAAMVGGMAYYILAKQVPQLTLGMDPIVMAIIVSATLMIFVSLETKKPSKETLQVFFGREKPEKVI
jgi:sodium/pantothenate symporter